MGSFILPPEHIAAIVGSLEARGGLESLNSSFGKSRLYGLCLSLASLNAASVSNRYGERRSPVEVTEEMINAFVVCPLSPIDTLQAIRSLRYQSGEAGSRALEMLKGIEECAVAVIARRANPNAWSISSLPEGSENIVKLT